MLPPQFHPHNLIPALPALNTGAATTESVEKAAYMQFYRLPDAHEYAGMEHRMGLLETAGQRICVQVYRPRGARATLYLLHGYFDHVGLFGHLIRWALDHDFAVVTFDLPGHGLSSGDQATINSFLEYVEVFDAVLGATSTELPRPQHAMGQSTGAAVIMEYLLSTGYGRDNCPFDHIMLLAPLVRPTSWPMGRLALLLLRPFLPSIRRSFADNTHDPEFQRFIREQDPLQARVVPLSWLTSMDSWIGRMLEHAPSDLSPLLVQGTNDSTVDWRYNLKVIRQKFRKPRVFYVANAGHHLANEVPALRSQYLAWLDGQLATD